MASRKEEQERRRAERLAAEQREGQAARRRLLAGYIVAGAMTLAIVIGLVIVLASGGDDGGSGGDAGDLPAEASIQTGSGSVHDFEPDGREGTEPPPIAQGDLEKAADAAGCDLELDLEEEGRDHISDASKLPDYATNPPTSGDHHPEQQADGAYLDAIAPEYFLHSMEHGRVAIQYSPDLSEDEQLELKGVFDEDPAGVLFFPNPDMPFEVAATAWTKLLGCDTYEGAATLDALRDFRDVSRSQAPENFPLVTG